MKTRHILIPVLFSLLIACGQTDTQPSAAAPVKTPAASTGAASDDTAKAQATPVATRSNERPIPNFGGRTLDGGQIQVSSLIGKRLLLFFFDPEVEISKDVGRGVVRIAAMRSDHNFEVLGVAIGSSTSLAAGFAKELNIDFPVIDDSSGAITRLLNLRSAVTLYGVDNEGYLSFGMARFAPENSQELVEDRLSQAMRLPNPSELAKGALSSRPKAPDFSAPWLAGGSDFEFSSIRGKPAVVIFFLHTCPHCHKALAFLKEQLAGMPEDKRPELIAISASNRGSEITATLKEEGLDFFPVLLDPDQKIQREYGVFGGFPDVMLVNTKGEIVHRVRGWSEGRDPALTRMLLAKIAGVRIPMLLNPNGYTGSDVCAVCHTQEHDTWQFTKHATAFDTLVTHAADRNSECIGCHVVGFEEAGGFSLDTRPAHLENVGCESCHGRGGPHLSPEFAKQQDYASVCETCHNKEHSLGFKYEDFRPAISHAAIAAMSNGQREELAAGRSRPGQLLPSSADYVGSAACESCHAAEFATWSTSPHATAGATLHAKGKAGESDCQVCHTTGYDLPGGFVKGSALEVGGDLSRVGCESCHGPGSDHVEESSTKLGSILSLGDKCDSCVILKICGSCHDQDNDPGFQFEVEAHIERQRHGTIEAGTGEKLEARVHERPGPQTVSLPESAHHEPRS